MRLLILGGTGFLGLHTALQALARGDEVWLFNRGKSRPDAMPDAKRLTGDRMQRDVSALRDAPGFDATIDCTGYFPHQVGDVAEALADRAGRYVFVSTVSVYEMPMAYGADEDAPLASMPADADASALTGETYGPLKVGCEQAAADAYGDRATIVRPGLIVGPEDPTDRFTYWIRRGIEGGRVLVPGVPERPIQVIDGRDVAAFLLRVASDDTAGTFNAVGEVMGFERLIATALGEDATIVWRDDQTLLDAGLQPWSDLPLWMPSPAGDTALTSSNARAVAAGLVVRPIEETVADTAAWDRSRDLPPLKAGIDRARQDALIA